MPDTIEFKCMSQNVKIEKVLTTPDFLSLQCPSKNYRLNMYFNQHEQYIFDELGDENCKLSLFNCLHSC